MQKLLIANRGEIAARIMRTAHRMGIATVAVASEVDADAPHVSLADEVYFIGKDVVNESYLDIEKILQAAKETGADAIHPGYGFLSENADFAAAVSSSGIIWVGPSAEAILAMGDKAAAKEKMAEAGVPMPKGFFGEQSLDVLQEEAERIGFPLLVKAVAGGGGRGIRIVRSAEELQEAVERSQSEALSAFGSADVMLEQFLEQAKHIEIQVFADTHGNAVHLFERDCSTQRRRQKIIEEAPSASLSEEMRLKMGETAANATKAIGYVGAGTLEFLVVGEEFYFLEMNTRLQVEHPVTELVTGLDLVEWQLRVADGEELPCAQDEIALTGHAVEARIYAEDPANGYMPSTGKIHLWLPSEEENLWIDSGVQGEQEISSFYDPMLAKIIVWGHNRSSAVRQLQRAIEHSIFIGPKSNHGFLLQVLSGEDFQTATMHTTRLEELQFDAQSPSDMTWAVAGILASHPEERPWNSRGVSSWKQRLVVGDDEKICQFQSSREGSSVSIGGQELEYSLVSREENQAIIRIGNHQQTWHFVLQEKQIMLWNKGWTHSFELPVAEPDQVRGDDASSLLSPMSGRVVAVLVEADAPVLKGDKIFVIEAMKMEHPVVAGCDGILKIHCSVNEQVQTQQLLGVIAEEEEN